jgi:hypothetical protein
MVEDDAGAGDPEGVVGRSRGWSGAEPVVRERPFHHRLLGDPRRRAHPARPPPGTGLHRRDPPPARVERLLWEQVTLKITHRPPLRPGRRSPRHQPRARPGLPRPARGQLRLHASRLHGRQGRPPGPHLGHGRPALPQRPVPQGLAVVLHRPRRRVPQGPLRRRQAQPLQRPRQLGHRLHAAVRPRPLHHRPRISYYNPLLGGRAGRTTSSRMRTFRTVVPRSRVGDTRVSQTSAAWEFAGYGYWGYWKSPGGMDLLSMKATFPG